MNHLLARRKGFTLIEVLIVVAVIGILASVVLVGVGRVRPQARDARRLADLREVQNALELFYNKFGKYPSQGINGPDGACASAAGSGNWSNMQTCLKSDTTNIGVKNVPDDPSGGNSHYIYGVSATGDSYVIGAQLEDSSNPALKQSLSATTYGVACSRGSANGGTDPAIYCIQL